MVFLRQWLNLDRSRVLWTALGETWARFARRQRAARRARRLSEERVSAGLRNLQNDAARWQEHLARAFPGRLVALVLADGAAAPRILRSRLEDGAGIPDSLWLPDQPEQLARWIEALERRRLRAFEIESDRAPERAGDYWRRLHGRLFYRLTLARITPQALADDSRPDGRRYARARPRLYAAIITRDDDPPVGRRRAARWAQAACGVLEQTRAWRAYLDRIYRRASEDELRAAELRLAAEERAAELERELKQVRRTLTRIAHDIRMPLQLARFVREDLLVSNGSPETIERAVAKLCEQHSFLERFANDLLYLQTGRRRPKPPEWCDARELLPRLFDAQLATQEARRIEVQYEFEGPLRFYLDPVALERILFNLGLNAVKFCSSPGRIYVRAAERLGHAFIDIEDTGGGFAGFATDFELNERLLPGAGTDDGVGLAAARVGAMELGGRLTAPRPIRGSGGRFLLVLPTGRTT